METLRKLAADYMLNHRDDFLPFLTDAKTGQLYTPGKQANKLEKYNVMYYFFNAFLFTGQALDR